MQSPRKCDIGIFTILPLELDAIKKILGLNTVERVDGIVYYTGTISTGEKNYSVVCSQSTDYSNLPAQSTTERMIQHWDPKFVITVGIAGGVEGREDLQLGDVVIPTEVYYTEVVKKADGKKLSRPNAKSPPAPEFRDAHQVAQNSNWKDVITMKNPLGENNSKVVYGQILSGEKLEGDPEDEELQEKLATFDKFLAVEMESGGVSRAVYEQSRWHNTKFFAVRGISDFCNVKKNKETRVNWGNYAAEAAAAYALELIKNLTIYENPADSYAVDVKQLFEPSPETIFNLNMSDDSGKVNLDQIISLSESKQKLVLVGRPGIGKSFAVNEIAKDIANKGGIPIVLSLNKWDGEPMRQFSSVDKIPEKMNALLGMSKVSLNEKFLLKMNAKKFFILEGLNEISSGEYGGDAIKDILSVVHEYVRNHALGSPIIATDRTKRNYTDSFHNVELKPLESDEMRKIIDKEFGDGKFKKLDKKTKAVLSIPFFLKNAIKSKNVDFLTETHAMEDFFKSHVGLNKEEIRDAAKTVFELSGTQGTLSFKPDEFENIAESSTYQKLVKGDVLLSSSDGTIHFQHQLQQEYLISVFLSSHPENWDITSLDAVTLKANSIDSLFMTIEQIEEKEKCDDFLLHIFNWNWRAAIRCIARLENKGSDNYSEYTLIAMAALVAQKKFDSVHGTHLEAIASLDGIQNENCKKMAAAQNFDDIIGIVNGISNGEDWFANWRNIFTWDSAKIPSDDDIMRIKSEESIVGWTSSNALKRLALNEIHQGQLRIMYLALLDESPLNSTVRWRIVHTLGSFPSKENAELLFKVIESDTYHWAKFGAARSLVEMAAKTEDSTLRKTIIDYFTQNHKMMHDAVREEIGKASMYHNAFGDWESSIRPLLESIGQSLDEELTKREWKKIMNRFNDGKWKTR